MEIEVYKKGIHNFLLKIEKNKTINSIYILITIEEIKKNTLKNRLISDPEVLTFLSESMSRMGHKFNNILQEISLNASLVKKLILEENIEEADEYLDKIIYSVFKAGSIMSQIFLFAGRTYIEKKRFDIQDFIKENRLDFIDVIGENISLVLHFKPKNKKNNYIIYGNPSVLKRAFINIMKNASEHLTEQGIKKGKITITISKTKSLKTIHNKEVIGNFIKISISDNGNGISEREFSRIFQPFNSSKFESEKMGMGLAETYGIINEMGGYINVISRKNKGTSVILFLPEQDIN